MEKLYLSKLTAHLVGAYVGKNSVPVAELPALISNVHATLAGLASVGKTAPEPSAKPGAQPAVNPKKSIYPDYLISLEDGKRYTMLRRHLNSLGMTPQQYREKWNLPTDYPMTSASYSAKRSALAKSGGLGRRNGPPGK